jgi:SAM-dependent methyltransferase
MLADAQRALDARAGRFELMLADAQTLPFARRSFDVVIANHMLYHVADRPLALREIRRVLAEDGHLMAATIGTAHLQEIDEWLRQVGIDVHGWGVASTHAFSLGNGAAQIAAVFGQVDERRYDDSLRVTEVEPIMAYIASMRTGSTLSDEVEAALRNRLAAQIAEHGYVHITKVSGLFLAHH